MAWQQVFNLKRGTVKVFANVVPDGPPTIDEHGEEDQAFRILGIRVWTKGMEFPVTVDTPSTHIKKRKFGQIHETPPGRTVSERMNPDGSDEVDVSVNEAFGHMEAGWTSK